MIVRGEGYHTKHAPDPVVRSPVAEEGAVAAVWTSVVLNHKQPHEEAPVGMAIRRLSQ
jgi:hypothetical protein